GHAHATTRLRRRTDGCRGEAGENSVQTRSSVSDRGSGASGPELTRIMPANVDVVEIVALLSRTPAALDALLRGLPDAWTRGVEGDGTWSAIDIVGHLIHGERTDWIPRARMILEHGESRTFESF